MQMNKRYTGSPSHAGHDAPGHTDRGPQGYADSGGDG